MAERSYRFKFLSIGLITFASQFWSFVRLARPLHWMKNLLVFVPLLATHAWGDRHAWGEALLTFVAFGLTASSGYMLNDILDKDTDARSAVKKRRPLPSGEISTSTVWMILPLVLFFGLTMARLVSVQLCGALVGYMLLSGFYSFVVKKIPVADVLLLACFLAARVACGGLATHTSLSPWLITASIFLFLSLALIKRVNQLKETAQGEALSAGYHSGDLALLVTFGCVSGYAAVLVLALYINGETVGKLYHHPQVLWLLVPLAIYWITRIWFLANRGNTESDPVLFALKDRVSYAALAIAAVFFGMAL